ncbi:hypothetical protein GCM10029976_078360 [Kribbella albertanoniae]|uniref:GNAT family N-acetyltransferase n=1 Tax=Kribbella albertanoniae TaxID=1266829 RepID=A0A4R4PM13_9ACTN|nr:GNAT family N-acetyltransferase [Kribbella albertanoniae]TDC23187.1 GNAT family N-acetyltransferase [Kribbella albertanoniae]
MLITLDESHRPLVYQIRADAEDWLEARDIDQYRRGLDPTVVRANIDREFDAGQFRGWQVDGEVVAVLAIIDPDPELWTPEEIAEPQTYVSRVMVAKDQHGKGYGSAMLKAVEEEASARGDHWIRLNCWSTNYPLHDYYRALGFEYVRTVDIPGRMSGALFQLDLTQAS